MVVIYLCIESHSLIVYGFCAFNQDKWNMTGCRGASNPILSLYTAPWSTTTYTNTYSPYVGNFDYLNIPTTSDHFPWF